MNLSDLAFKILLLFMPGIVCHMLIDALTSHKERKTQDIILLSLVYGFLAYIIFGILHAFWHCIINTVRDGNHISTTLPEQLTFIRSITDPTVKIDIGEIAFATAFSVPLAFIVSYMVNHKWLHRLAKWLKVSSKFGDLDVWSFAFNSKELASGGWATVRDIENGQMYMGVVQAYSDEEPHAELLLLDVVVYDEKTGDERYRADRMYLSRKKDSMTVEFPKTTG